MSSESSGSLGKLPDLEFSEGYTSQIIFQRPISREKMPWWGEGRHDEGLLGGVACKLCCHPAGVGFPLIEGEQS